MKQTIFITRFLFVLIMTYCGLRIAPTGAQLKFTAIFLFASLLIILLEYSTRIISSKKMLFAVAGLFAGLIMANLINPMLHPTIIEDKATSTLVSNLLFGYMGVVLFLRHSDRFSLSRLKFIVQNPTTRNLILDTNVIIDGRFVEIWETGFVTGHVIIPDFVLQELQLIADSRDS